jgi:hypothetical protein
MTREQQVVQQLRDIFERSRAANDAVDGGRRLVQRTSFQ